MAAKSIAEILNNVNPPNYYELRGLESDDTRADIQEYSTDVDAAVAARQIELETLMFADKRYVLDNENIVLGSKDVVLGGKSEIVQKAIAALGAMISTAQSSLKNRMLKNRYDAALGEATADKPFEYPEAYVSQYITVREGMLGRPLELEELPSSRLRETHSRITATLKTRDMSEFATKALEYGLTPNHINNEPIYDIKLGGKSESDIKTLINLASHIGLKGIDRESISAKQRVLSFFPADTMVAVILAGAGTFTEVHDSSGALTSITFKRSAAISKAVNTELLSKALAGFMKDNKLLPDALDSQNDTLIFNDSAKIDRIKTLLKTAYALEPLNTQETSVSRRSGGTSPAFSR